MLTELLYQHILIRILSKKWRLVLWIFVTIPEGTWKQEVQARGLRARFLDEVFTRAQENCDKKLDRLVLMLIMTWHFLSNPADVHIPLKKNGTWRKRFRVLFLCYASWCPLTTKVVPSPFPSPKNPGHVTVTAHIRYRRCFQRKRSVKPHLNSLRHWHGRYGETCPPLLNMGKLDSGHWWSC